MNKNRIITIKAYSSEELDTKVNKFFKDAAYRDILIEWKPLITPIVHTNGDVVTIYSVTIMFKEC